jgi:hypothetical protein
MIGRETPTASCGGQLNKTERRVISWHGLKGNVAMPLSSALLLGVQSRVTGRCRVELLVLDRTNGADLKVIATKFPL